MAVYDILPMNGELKKSDIRETLNSNGGVTDNKFSSLFKAAANHNIWSFHKPYRNGALFRLTDAQIRNMNCGLVPFQIASYTSLSDSNVMDGEMNGWEYELPLGTGNSPYRISDFRGYYTGAEPMIRNFTVADEISSTSSEAYATAIVTQQDGIQVSLADLGELSDYHAAVFVRNNSDTSKYRMYYNEDMTIGESGTFGAPIKVSDLTNGEWTAYPFLLGGSTNSTYFTIPNVSPKVFKVVATLDDLTIYAEYVYADSATLPSSLRFKFTLENKSGGNTKNNYVYLTRVKDDITVETAQGEYSRKLPDLPNSGTYNYPYDYNGMEWEEISVLNFNPSYIRWVVISIGSGRFIRSVNIMQQVQPQ